MAGKTLHRPSAERSAADEEGGRLAADSLSEAVGLVHPWPVRCVSGHEPPNRSAGFEGSTPRAPCDLEPGRFAPLNRHLLRRHSGDPFPPVLPSLEPSQILPRSY